MTIAYKNQIQLAQELHAAQHISPRLSWGPIIHQQITESENYDRFKHLIQPSTPADQIFETKWVSVYGTHYEKGLCIVCEEKKNGVQYCGKILHIGINEKKSQIIFFFKILTTLETSEHLQGSVMEGSEIWDAVCQEDLVYFKARKLVKLYDNHTYVVTAF